MTAEPVAAGTRTGARLTAVSAPADGSVGYGGYRVQPGYYEPVRVPPEVARYGNTTGLLPPGSPGKVGVLQLEFGLNGPQTQLVGHYQKSPLQIMRPLYWDPLRPDMPYTFLMSTGGGIVEGDRLRTDLSFGPGTSAHVTTSAHTKVHRMKDGYAVAQVDLRIGPDAYVEYLPDPLIVFAEARLYQRTTVTLDGSATLLAGETLVAGRLARGEQHRYTVLATDFEVRRPDGTLVAVDRVRLSPEDGGTGGPAVLGDRTVLAMLYVLTSSAPTVELGDLLHGVLAPTAAEGDLHVGVSTLPGDAGVWVRIVGNDREAVSRANDLAWRALRLRLTGHEAPAVRKY